MEVWSETTSACEQQVTVERRGEEKRGGVERRGAHLDREERRGERHIWIERRGERHMWIERRGEERRRGTSG